MKSSKKKSIDMFRKMIDSCPVWISFVDEEFKYLIANDYYTKTFNLPLSQIEGHNFKEFFPPDLYEKHKQLINKCVQKGEALKWEDKHDFKKEETVYIYGIYTPLINDDGSLKGITAFGLDITKLKKTEFELKNQYRSLEKKVAERTKEIEQKNLHLKETNIALKVLLKNRKKDKKEVEKNLYHNFEKLIFPYLEKLKGKVSDPTGNSYLDILESNLKEITSLFSSSLSEGISRLTPAELQIANLVKNGKTTKEIAELLNLSKRTINFHRENIRDKLGLKNQKTNLRSHLMSIA